MVVYVMCLCDLLQALKVLRSAEYAPFVVFIAAPRAADLHLANASGIDVSDSSFVPWFWLILNENNN